MSDPVSGSQEPSSPSVPAATTVPPTDPFAEDSEGGNIFEYLYTLWKYKWVLIIVPTIVVVSTAFYMKAQPSEYETHATLFSLVEAAPQIPSGLGGFASLLGLETPRSTNPLVFLNSRSFHEQVIEKHDLIPDIFPKMESMTTPPTLVQAASLMTSRVRFKSERPPVLIVSVLWLDDNKMAARMANLYAEEAILLFREKTLNKTKANRQFVEQQLSAVEAELVFYEEEIKKFVEEHGMVPPNEYANLLGAPLSRLKSELLTYRLELQTLPSNSAQANIVSEKITIWEQAIRQMELGQSIGEGEAPQSGFEIPLAQVPALNLEYSRLQRELQVKQDVYKMLIQQLEVSKIEENRSSETYEILDTALEPTAPSRPKKRLIVAISGILGGSGAVVLVFIISILRKDWDRYRQQG